MIPFSASAPPWRASVGVDYSRHGRRPPPLLPSPPSSPPLPPGSPLIILLSPPAGIFTFESASQRVSESVGVMEVKVLRTSGARGLVAVPYRAVDGTAKGGEDYELAAGKLEFQNDETM